VTARRHRRTAAPVPLGVLRIRSGSFVALALAALLVAACVPPPAGRASATPGPATASPSSQTTPSPTGPTPEPSFVRPTPTPLPTFLAYTVRSGDTLSSISRTFSTTPLSIAYWNRDTYPSLDPESEGYQPDRIVVGWTLLVMPGVILDGSDLPEPSPAASPTAGPSATPSSTATPAPSTGGTSRRVGHGSRDSTMVALTLDMGGRLDPALDIMDWLIEHDVHATIFPTGKTGSTTTTGRAALALVVEHPELFDLGNHSWSHPDFRDLSDERMVEELERTESALVALLGVSPRPWFRPPFGGVSDRVLDTVGRAGYGYTVMWDVDTIDWRPESDGGPSAEEIVDKVVGAVDGGSIVLMHLGGFNTLEALPGIVDGLRAKGLTPVTLGEMFGA
jgi:peptidoglycan/xylan/chitin deacetylase (PgdA/CDA1 family)